MGVMAAEGFFGSGKTAFCVCLAREIAYRRGGCPIWANFSLVGSKPVHSIAELYKCTGGVIVLDELQGTIHARTSGKNLEFLDWFDQCRKSNSDVICITQAFEKIDVIVREMIEIGFSCTKKPDAGEFMSRVVPMDMSSGRSRSAFLFDRSAAFPYYDHMERAWPLRPKEEPKKVYGGGR
jgi:hypothetical protein